MSDSAVELTGVRYHAGGARILDDVSVAFRRGAFNVVLGPNGAGKSTLLRVATGLAMPAAGEVTYGGRALRSFEGGELARTRAVLSQHVELAFPLPVWDVAMMGRYPYFDQVPSARDREIVRAAIELVGMTERAQQPYPTLSGGEQQKVHLARVLAQIWNFDSPAGADSQHRPHRCLFLDEPTTNLDVHYQIHLLDAARSLLAHDCTVVAVLHDINVALEYGDRFVLLEAGRVALATDDAAAMDAATLERVFRVNARRVDDAGRPFWRFSVPGHPG